MVYSPAELRQAAEQLGISPVTAAVASVLTNQTVSSAIIGASKPDQLSAHIRATWVDLPVGLVEWVDRARYQLPRRPPELDTPRMADSCAVVS